ncbi:MAG: response regulator [Gammaproteobacteria bacterium]|nr:response regulator [Gammaproteobacteria bacterium]
MNDSVRKEVILVVDDSAEALSVVNDTLEDAGFDVLVALEGKQALAITQRIRPDMILLDAIMPNMDGFETCVALKKAPELAAIPVIFMTGLSDTDSIVKGLAAGGVDYLTKPIRPDELVARMHVHLNNARVTHSAHRALDHAGQFLFSVDSTGHTLWATPQTHVLFSKAGADNAWRNSQLVTQLGAWFTQQPQPGQRLPLADLPYGLSVEYLQDLNDNERLLKLAENNQAPGEDVLKQNLNLTTRESQVLYWLSNGKTNREIAEILGMSPRTVNKHLEQIFPKLGVENRTAAARVAIAALNRSH